MQSQNSKPKKQFSYFTVSALLTVIIGCLVALVGIIGSSVTALLGAVVVVVCSTTFAVLSLRE